MHVYEVQILFTLIMLKLLLDYNILLIRSFTGGGSATALSATTQRLLHLRLYYRRYFRNKLGTEKRSRFNRYLRQLIWRRGRIFPLSTLCVAQDGQNHWEDYITRTLC